MCGGAGAGGAALHAQERVGVGWGGCEGGCLAEGVVEGVEGRYGQRPPRLHLHLRGGGRVSDVRCAAQGEEKRDASPWLF